MGQFYGSWGQKKEICVFPVSQPFASGIRNVRNPNLFWIDLPDLDGNQAILLKKRFEKLFRSSSARNHRVKFCLVNENADNTVQYFKYRRVPTKLTSSCKKCFKKKKVDLSFLQDEIGSTHFFLAWWVKGKKTQFMIFTYHVISPEQVIICESSKNLQHGRYPVWPGNSRLTFTLPSLVFKL